jgi:glycosyltransferase involved in cell wall biosynthesis
VIPSYGDSLPLVYGEALQAGIPLIVTEVGDMGSLTRRYELGSVVNPGDVGGLAAAMEEMVSSGPPQGYAARMQGLLRRLHPSVAASHFLSAVFEDVT